MTIFPTHKTELKTALSKQEVLERLERNNIYTVGYYYKLKESGTSYALEPVHKGRGRNVFISTVNMKVYDKLTHTIVSLKFLPLKANCIGFLIILLLFIGASAGVAVYNIINTGFSIVNLGILLVGVFLYLIFMLMFSFEVISTRKQIEETIEAEVHEVTEDEKSKLQKWYEKDREPFKFRNK